MEKRRKKGLFVILAVFLLVGGLTIGIVSASTNNGFANKPSDNNTSETDTITKPEVEINDGVAADGNENESTVDSNDTSGLPSNGGFDKDENTSTVNPDDTSGLPSNGGFDKDENTTIVKPGDESGIPGGGNIPGIGYNPSKPTVADIVKTIKEHIASNKEDWYITSAGTLSLSSGAYIIYNGSYNVNFIYVAETSTVYIHATSDVTNNDYNNPLANRYKEIFGVGWSLSKDKHNFKTLEDLITELLK